MQAFIDLWIARLKSLLEAIQMMLGGMGRVHYRRT